MNGKKLIETRKAIGQRKMARWRGGEIRTRHLFPEVIDGSGSVLKDLE